MVAGLATRPSVAPNDSACLVSSQLNDGLDFCNFALLLVSVSTCQKFCAEHFETQKLPREGFGRLSELLFYEDGVGANIFGGF